MHCGVLKGPCCVSEAVALSLSPALGILSGPTSNHGLFSAVSDTERPSVAFLIPSDTLPVLKFCCSGHSHPIFSINFYFLEASMFLSVDMCLGLIHDGVCTLVFSAVRVPRLTLALCQVPGCSSEQRRGPCSEGASGVTGERPPAPSQAGPPGGWAEVSEIRRRKGGVAGAGTGPHRRCTRS